MPRGRHYVPPAENDGLWVSESALCLLVCLGKCVYSLSSAESVLSLQALHSCASSHIIKPRRIHEMLTIAIGHTGVCQSVCPSVTRAKYAKTAERIDVLFRIKILGDLKRTCIRWKCLSLSDEGIRCGFCHLFTRNY